MDELQPVCGVRETLVNKALGIKSRLENLSYKSNEIHGILFGAQVEECCGNDPLPRSSFESTLNDMERVLVKLEDSLGDTLSRL